MQAWQENFVFSLSELSNEHLVRISVLGPNEGDEEGNAVYTSKSGWHWNALCKELFKRLVDAKFIPLESLHHLEQILCTNVSPE